MLPEHILHHSVLLKAVDLQNHEDLHKHLPISADGWAAWTLFHRHGAGGLPSLSVQSDCAMGALLLHVVLFQVHHCDLAQLCAKPTELA